MAFVAALSVGDDAGAEEKGSAAGAGADEGNPEVKSGAAA